MSSTLLSHALMVGLTPLIPIPFLDDVVRGLLTRRMLQALVRERGADLDEETLAELTAEEAGGCFLGGCLSGCLLMPFKRILRKFLFVLEWKRATDLIARAYVYGMLVDDLLAQGWKPGRQEPTAVRVRLAAEIAMATVGTSPVVHAVGAVVEGTQDTLRGAAALLQRALARKGPREVEPVDSGFGSPMAERLLQRGRRGREARREIEQAVEEVEREEEERLSPVAERLAQALTKVPDAYFERLRHEFRRELAHEPTPPASEAGQ